MFFGLFKKKPEPDDDDQNIAVGNTNIRYKPDLIDDLKSDHAHLLNVYTDIKIASDSKDFTKVEEHLITFRNELEDHLLKEKINLYIYLSHLLKSDATNASLISGFRKEMDGISSIVMKFLVKYESIGTDINLHNSFQKEFATIGEVLGQRIKREESQLYSLYVPPS